MKKGGDADGTGRTAAVTASENGEDVAAMIVKRSSVVEWVQKHTVDLHNAVREEGFLGEWAMSEVDANYTDVDE